MSFYLFSNHYFFFIISSSLIFFCKIGDLVHEEGDATSFTTPSPHPPVFNYSPPVFDKLLPAFDAIPTFEHQNTQSIHDSGGVVEHLFAQKCWNDVASLLHETNETQRSTNDQREMGESPTRPGQAHKITEVIF